SFQDDAKYEHGGQDKRLQGGKRRSRQKDKDLKISNEKTKSKDNDKRRYALESAAGILDMVPTKNVDRTPYEIWHGKAPKLSYLKVEPQSIGVPVCRFTRIPQGPNRFGFYVDVEDHELGDLNEPSNYKAALSDPESDKWLEAMNTEIQSMKDNQVWCLVDLPPNGQTVGTKWLFKKKSDMDVNVHNFKAHLVAKCFS
nr:hypothetical protein [Tanacetum cinerariifolium]GFA66074.1 hypothetical protein [Tanacetum cinerariifolium]